MQVITNLSTVSFDAAGDRLSAGVIRRRPVVLMVDCEPESANATAAFLVESGLSVLVAQSEHDALQMAAVAPPNLLIANVTKPGVRAIGLVIALKSAVPDCDVLLTSSQDWPVDLLEMAIRGGLTFMCAAKPLHHAVLQPYVLNLLDPVYRDFSLKKTTSPSCFNIAASPPGTPSQGHHRNQVA